MSIHLLCRGSLAEQAKQLNFLPLKLDFVGVISGGKTVRIIFWGWMCCHVWRNKITNRTELTRKKKIRTDIGLYISSLLIAPLFFGTPVYCLASAKTRFRARAACQRPSPLPQPSEYMGKSCHIPTWTSTWTPRSHDMPQRFQGFQGFQGSGRVTMKPWFGKVIKKSLEWSGPVTQLVPPHALLKHNSCWNMLKQGHIVIVILASLKEPERMS